MHLLHLEDSPTDAELIGMLIRQEWPQCCIHHVTTAGEYRAALEGAVDLILSDYTVPGFDGLAALALARARHPDTPFVFLSGTIGEERAVEALKRGATDYIIKDRPTRLIPAIRQALALVAEAERRRATEEALQVNEARLREQALLLDRARDAIIATDLERRITYWNASAERLYGWTASEVIGLALNEFGLDFDPGRFAAARAGLLAHGEWRGDFRLRTRSGGTVLVETTWSLVGENDGRPRSILYIDTDVTERKRLEAQLLRAQRMESIGTLAGGIAHDLNNVLTPIFLSIEMLASKATAPEDQLLLEKTKASATHGAALLQQLLAFARGSEGRRTRIQPGQALAELQPLIQQSLPRTVTLMIRADPTAWSILADPTQFKQVLVNLCLNARDAMPAGGQIEIATRNAQVDTALAKVNPGATAGRHLQVSVRDTGMGIPAGIIDKIFDPFFTTKPAGKGTGLGLSVVAGILKSHSGFVQVESEAGKGTVFHLLFPALMETATRPPQPDTTGPAAGGEARAILLIDDEPLVRDTVQLLLQRAGYRVFAAEDGNTGIRRFTEREREIALVITDMMLPDQLGTEVVRSLRQRRAELPVIAISGMMASGNFDELLHLTPPVECLAKPLSPATLLAAIRRGLGAGCAQPK